MDLKLTQSTVNKTKQHIQTAQQWDVIVIGAGVVGCAIVRQLTLNGLKVLLLERGADILSGASKANSAILHTGFDAVANSLELECMRAGYKEYIEIRHKLNLPLLKTGALLVAWNEQQLSQLPSIVSKAHENGSDDVKQIDLPDLIKREPNLSNNALGAVEISQEYVIDPWSAPLAYVTQAAKAGAQYQFNSEVTDGEFDGKLWCLETTIDKYKAKLVINCSGNNGDIVQSICETPKFAIKPRKGQFIVFDKSAYGLVNSIILPVPTATTKGVVITKTIFGNLLLGPTAEEQQDRYDTSVDANILQNLFACGVKMLPDLEHHGITATYAGLRPATQFKDYQIEANPSKNWVGVNGIRSTGLTSALGIAKYVEKLCLENFADIVPFNNLKDIYWPQMPNLAAHKPRAFEIGDGTEIICHCEHVTRGQLESALKSEIAAKSVGGIRRRTRVMMGRCNGFYCSAKVSELTKGAISPPQDSDGGKND